MPDHPTNPPAPPGTPSAAAELESTSEDDPDTGLAIALRLETADTEPPLEGWLTPLLRRVAAEEGVTEGELTIVLVDDARMGALHGRYKGDPDTTDVLTFDLRDDEDGPIEGDIVVCRDEAERQAARRGHDARVEVLLYAVHGLMHLLGEDDEDEEDFDRMHAREDRVLTAVGVGKVFERSAGGGEADGEEE